MLSEGRIERILTAIAKRQWDLTVIVENVHDPHNRGAIMRSCESVGITEVFFLFTESTKNPDRYIGRNAMGGVSKWIKARFYEDMDECMAEVRKTYDKILATHLYQEAQSVYDTELTGSVAILFGNEHLGVSPEALAHCDGNIIIPIHGMVESLNVSVACSIILYEALRQRTQVGKYAQKFDLEDTKMREILPKYIRNARPRLYDMNPEVMMQEVHNYLKKTES